MTPRAPKARSLVIVTLLLLLAALATTGSQCTKVGDRVASPDEVNLSPDALASSPCVEECIADFRAAQRAENILHRQAIRACRTAPDPHECHRLESERHSVQVHEIARQLQQCLGECHNQGLGHGGE